MHKIKVLILLLTVLVAYGCNQPILSSNPPPSYPQSDTQLCEIATNIKLDGTIVWSTKLPSYVSKAKSRKLDCLSKNTDLAATKASVAINDYTDEEVCDFAVDDHNPQQWDITDNLKFVKIAEARKLACGIVDRPFDTSNAASLPNYLLCPQATRTDDLGIKHWKIRERPLHVTEAKKRGITCGIGQLTQTPIIAAPNSPTLSNSNVTQKNIEFLKLKKKSRNDVAIIIGNSDYRRNGQDIPNVSPAKNDARAFKTFAQEQLGINSENIIYIDDATTSQLERVFGNSRSYKGNAYNWVRPGKSKLYVYYAGHGAPGDDGTAYLVPSDASASSIDINRYPIATLYANLSKIPSKSTTVILESCFSGNSSSGSVINNASPVYMKAKDISIPSNLTVITAGSMNQLASWTPDKKHGLFTYHYIKGMSGDADGPDYGNQDGDVSMTELQAYLDDNVTYYARRHYGRDQNVQISLAE